MGIKCFLGFHPVLHSEEYNPYGLEPESRIIYTSPWAQFGIKETRYKCTKCNRMFWFTKGDMDWMKANERFYQSLLK